jgi:hypothetical protein
MFANTSGKARERISIQHALENAYVHVFYVLIDNRALG